ncbi:major facilitator superfamily domain-containing protein [Auriculariales sp. MPI-PUGE-AT-0066]|nr:major facilitator superfamily domain-containing protein [Auriculariales sp. MPI-PUGE-AT-0066]
MPFPPIAASAPRMPRERPTSAGVASSPTGTSSPITATTTITHEDQLDFSLSPTVRHSMDNLRSCAEALEQMCASDPEKLICKHPSVEKIQDTIEAFPCPTHDPDAFHEKLHSRLEDGLSRGLTLPIHELDYPEGGRGWVVVMGCTLIASVTMGWGLTAANLFPHASQASLSMIGSYQALVMTLTVFPIGKLQDKFGYKRFLAPGCALAVLHLFLSAFSSKIWQFSLTQGVLQGLAFGCILPAITSIPAQYFKKKRGLAIGIVMAGASFGGGIGAIIARVLLSTYGLRKAFLIHFGMHSFCALVGCLLVQERKEASEVSRAKSAHLQWYDKKIVEDRCFWGLGTSILFAGFGYLPLIFYLSIYTKDVVTGVSDASAVLPVTLMNVAAAAGRIAVGYAADQVGPVNAFMVSVAMSGLVQLVWWNFSRSLALILVMSLALGFFGASFVSLTGPVAAHIYGTERLGAILGLLTLFNAPSNLGAGPLAGAILDASGGNWHAVIGFSGSVQVLAGLCMLYVRLQKQPKIIAIY